MKNFTKILILLVALAFAKFIYNCSTSSEIKAPPAKWWGPGSAPSTEDTAINPFEINVTQKVLDDLAYRLKNARFVPPLEGIQHEYGLNTNLLKEVVDYWAKDYNWREREKFLNQFDQFKTNIQGLNIHFLHVKPTNVPHSVKILPLLMMHGWPESVRDFYEMIPVLTTVQKEKNFVFEVIAPSLPGYGFSDPAVRPGLSTPHIAVIFRTLMQRLGFDKYYIHAGDWGSFVGNHMSSFYPENVKGIHLNMCLDLNWPNRIKLVLGALWPSLVVEPQSEYKLYPLSKLVERGLREMGYFHVQTTKPDTIGVAFTDSPVGLAAYIIEKLVLYTNLAYEQRADGCLKEKFTYDKVLDNIMIYWISNSMTSSMRLYAESLNKVENLFDQFYPVSVPTKCAKFKYDLFYQPDDMLKNRYSKLIPSSYYEDGGHFAALELPDVLVGDLWNAVNVFENQQ